MAVGVARAFLAVGVCIRTRVRRVDGGRRAVGGAVVGQREIDVAVGIVDGAPLGAVHLGCTDRIGREAGVDQHIRLVREGVAGEGPHRRDVDAQFEPVARAVGIELGGVQLAFVQVLVAGGNAAADIAGVPDRGADELVDVFVARVAAHVDREGLADFGQAEDRGFVREAAHRDALDSGGAGERIDLNVVTEGVRLVAEVVSSGGTHGRHVPACEAVVARVRRMPALRGRGGGAGCDRRTGHAIAGARSDRLGVHRVGALRHREVDRPVLFAAEVGAPGRDAMAAVVQGAARGAAATVVPGNHEGPDVVQVRGRAGDADRGLRGDPTVVDRVDHVAPAAARTDHLDQAHAVVVDLLEHLQRRAVAEVPVTELRELLACDAVRGLAGRMEEVGVGRALVVDGEHRATGVHHRVLAVAADEIDVHAIVVVTDALRPVVGLGAPIAVGRDRGDQAVAGGVQHGDGVAGGQDHAVGDALGGGREPERRSGGGKGGRHSGVVLAAAAGHEGHAAQRGESETAADHAASRGAGDGAFEDVLEVFVIRVIVDGVEGVRHEASPGGQWRPVGRPGKENAVRM